MKHILIIILMFVSTIAFARDKKVDNLVSAAASGNINAVRDLIDKGADVNASDIEGNFPLFAAVVCDHTDVVELLIKKGANVNQSKASTTLPVIERNINALLAASVIGNQSVVELLINAGADVNAFANPNSETLAHTLAHMRADATIEESCWPVACQAGFTPLKLASKFDHAAIVALLLAHGADVNFQMPGDNTALIEAAIFGRRDVIELLIKQKADLNRKGEEGGTALAHALINEQYESAKVLLEAGAEFQYGDYYTGPRQSIQSASLNGTRHFASGAYQALVADKLMAEGRSLEATNKFTEALSLLTAARDELNKTVDYTNQLADKEAKIARRHAILNMFVDPLAGSQSASFDDFVRQTRHASQWMRNQAQEYSRREAACDYLIRYMAKDMAFSPELRKLAETYISKGASSTTEGAGLTFQK
jgi:hypothetical protein